MIYIGAGHGGTSNGATDYGASGQGTTEFAECTQIVTELLNKHRDLIHIVPQRLALPARIAWMNRHLAPGDIYLECHLNSTGGAMTEGAEIYYLAGNANRRQRAEAMINRYCASTGQENRGARVDTSTRFKRLGVIRDVQCESYLIELGFISSPKDLAKVRERAVFGLEELLEVVSTDPDQYKVADWAASAWEKAIRKGIIRATTNPKLTMLSDGGTDEEKNTFEWIWKNMGAIDKVIGKGMELQRLMVALDRLGVLDRLPDKK